MADLAKFATASGLAERWFYLRYGDPEPRLRLRFGGQPDLLLGQLLPEVPATTAALIDNGSCLRVQFDTYDREIERYGGLAAMDAVEDIFRTDSETVLALLAAEATWPWTGRQSPY